MNTEHLREFMELAQCLNYTETANKLNLTQPALSKHILALEKEFGTALLDRNRKGIQLTEGGRVLFESAGIILNKLDETKETLASLKAKSPIRITGHLEEPDVASLSSMIAMLARENYHSNLIFDRITSNDPLTLLEEDAADLFVGYTDVEKAEKAGLCCQPFVTSRLTAIIGTAHPLAQRKSLNWEDLRNETLIKFISEKTNPAWDQIERACQKNGFSPKTRPISSLNDVEFFSTPLRGSILVWKETQKQIGLILETGRRASVPIIDDDALLIAYAVYKPEKTDLLEDFFKATEEAKGLLDRRKERISQKD